MSGNYYDQLSADELRACLIDKIMELTLEERAQLLAMLKAEGLIKGVADRED